MKDVSSVEHGLVLEGIEVTKINCLNNAIPEDPYVISVHHSRRMQRVMVSMVNSRLLSRRHLKRLERMEILEWLP